MQMVMRLQVFPLFSRCFRSLQLIVQHWIEKLKRIDFGVNCLHCCKFRPFLYQRCWTCSATPWYENPGSSVDFNEWLDLWPAHFFLCRVGRHRCATSQGFPESSQVIQVIHSSTHRLFLRPNPWDETVGTWPRRVLQISTFQVVNMISSSCQCPLIIFRPPSGVRRQTSSPLSHWPTCRPEPVGKLGTNPGWDLQWIADAYWSTDVAFGGLMIPKVSSAKKNNRVHC